MLECPSLKFVVPTSRFSRYPSTPCELNVLCIVGARTCPVGDLSNGFDRRPGGEELLDCDADTYPCPGAVGQKEVVRPNPGLGRVSFGRTGRSVEDEACCSATMFTGGESVGDEYGEIRLSGDLLRTGNVESQEVEVGSARVNVG